MLGSAHDPRTRRKKRSGIHAMFFGIRHHLYVALGLLLPCFIFSSCKAAVESAPAGLPEVATVTLCTEKISLTTELPGRTAAYLVAEIRPQVNGLIQTRNFKEGSFVREGELLYQIDPLPYKAAFDQATAARTASESELAVAEANLPALRMVFRETSPSTRQFD